MANRALEILRVVQGGMEDKTRVKTDGEDEMYPEMCHLTENELVLDPKEIANGLWGTYRHVPMKAGK